MTSTPPCGTSRTLTGLDTVPQREVRTPWLFAVPDYAETVAYEMYPGQRGQGDARDAARHMLAAGTLARKYSPETAALLGRLHEYKTSPLAALKTLLGLGEMPPDYEQDMHNNRLGIQAAGQATSQAELEDLIQSLAERSVPRRAEGSPWVNKARGGLAQVKKECSCGHQ